MMSALFDRWTFTWPVATVASLLLVGCQSNGIGPQAAAEGWRVVERSGEARALTPANDRWSTLAAGDVVPVPSTVVTGPASRVILVRDLYRVRLEPDSRITLPTSGGRHLLEQERGAVDYQITGTPGHPIRIATPHAEAESRAGAFRIEVGPDLERTAFEVSEGSLRVAHKDGARGVTIRPDQQALARAADGPKLAFSTARGAPFEAVAPVIAAIVGDQAPPAALQGGASEQAAAPERHPSARQAVAARSPTKPLARQNDATEGDHEKAAQQHERIILPATFRPEPPEEAAEVDQRATGTGDEPAGDAPWSLTEGLLEGLPRTSTPEP